MNYFNLKLHNTTVRKEIISGIITFIAMSYILAVNPKMLGEVGMDERGVFVATIVTIIITTLVGALYTKMPLAYAPSISLNTIAIPIVIEMCDGEWSMVMLATYLSGVMLLLLLYLGIYDRVVTIIPSYVKYSIMAGIGLAIALMGAQYLQVVSISKYGISVHSLLKKEVLFSIIAIIMVHIMYLKKKRGAVAVGLLVTYILVAISELITYYQTHGHSFHHWLDTYMSHGITMKNFTNVAYQFPTAESYLFDYTKLIQLIMIVFTFTMIHFFDSYGTVAALLERIKEEDKNFNKDAQKKCMLVNAIGAIVSGCAGTTSVTSYAENVAGIENGAKTGLSAIVVCIGFALSVFFAPVFAVMSEYMVAPIMIYVGMIFLYNLKKLREEKLCERISAIVIFLYAGITFQLGIAVCLGLLLNIVLRVITGRHKEITKKGILVVLSCLISLLIMLYC